MNGFLIVILVILAAAALLFILTGICLHLFFGRRWEENPSLRYKTEQDFPDMKAEPVSFLSGNNRLSGAFYSTLPEEKLSGLVIFVHGIGAGHHSYTTEIHTLAQAGFLVLSYDQTGCVASEGKSMRSFYQGVRDLNAALRFLEADESKKQMPVGIVGHSWGAYITCQAMALQSAYRVRAIVALSAFNRADTLLSGQISAATRLPARLLRPFIRLHLYILDGSAGTRSCSDALRRNMTPALLFHGLADSSVPVSCSPATDRTLCAEPHITTHLLKNRYHNVYQTAESEQYLNETFAAIGKAQEEAKKQTPETKEHLESLYSQIDYERITEEDPAVMREITDFLHRHLGV